MCFAGTNRYISLALLCCNTYIERDLETATRSMKDAQNTLLQRAKPLIAKQRLFIADAKWTRPVRVGPHRQQLLLCSESSGFNEAVLQTRLAWSVVRKLLSAYFRYNTVLALHVVTPNGTKDSRCPGDDLFVTDLGDVTQQRRMRH
jgi:hypothetical protein